MSRLCRVIDTNVLLVANGQHAGVSPSCITACVRALDHIRSKGIVVIDDGYEILSEYKVRTNPNTGNRVGDAFLKWLYQNAGNPKRVARVKITKHPARGYVEFPIADGLKDFDPADRKFVAVAVKHGRRPPIFRLPFQVGQLDQKPPQKWH